MLRPTRTVALALSALALIGGALAGCTEPAEVGEVCINSADCVEGLRCIDHVGQDPSQACMSECDPTTTRLCATGEVCGAPCTVGEDGVCRVTDPAVGVCYLGGTTAIGSDCILNSDCIAGAICVSRDDLDPVIQQCYQACTVGDETPCAAGETCMPLTSAGLDGFCDAT
jgi:hypothetical protein